MCISISKDMCITYLISKIYYIETYKIFQIYIEKDFNLYVYITLYMLFILII